MRVPHSSRFCLDWVLLLSRNYPTQAKEGSLGGASALARPTIRYQRKRKSEPRSGAVEVSPGQVAGSPRRAAFVGVPSTPLLRLLGLTWRVLGCKQAPGKIAD